MEYLKRASLVYLATPYTHYPRGLEVAHRDAARLSAKLIMTGINVYSPIVQTHPIAIYGGLKPRDHAFWMRFDEAIMMKSDVMLVGQFDTWERSDGIAFELKYFRAANKPVRFIDPHTLIVTEDRPS